MIAFSKGTQGSSEQVGTIPADYSQGSGTLATGTTADKATEAALAAYPGGVVDRVVKLSNGEYEVHYIGVNWSHHIFVNQDFQVIGAIHSRPREALIRWSPGRGERGGQVSPVRHAEAAGEVVADGGVAAPDAGEVVVARGDVEERPGM